MANKENFSRWADKQVKMDKALLKAVELAEGVIRKQAGKVVNARIATLLQKELDDAFGVANGKEFIATLKDASYSDYRGLRIVSVDTDMRSWVSDRHTYNYLERDSSDINVYFDLNGRLDLERTLKDVSMARGILTNETEAIADELENFDRYIEWGERVAQAVKEYNDKVPYELRKKIRVEYGYQSCWL